MNKLMKLIVTILNSHKILYKGTFITIENIDLKHNLVTDYGMDTLDILELEFSLEAVLVKYTKHNKVYNTKIETVADIANVIIDKLQLRVSK